MKPIERCVVETQYITTKKLVNYKHNKIGKVVQRQVNVNEIQQRKRENTKKKTLFRQMYSHIKTSNYETHTDESNRPDSYTLLYKNGQ